MVNANCSLCTSSACPMKYLVEPCCHVQRKGSRPSQRTRVQQDGATILPLSRTSGILDSRRDDFGDAHHLARILSSIFSRRFPHGEFASVLRRGPNRLCYPDCGACEISGGQPSFLSRFKGILNSPRRFLWPPRPPLHLRPTSLRICADTRSSRRRH